MANPPGPQHSCSDIYRNISVEQKWLVILGSHFVPMGINSWYGVMEGMGVGREFSEIPVEQNVHKSFSLYACKKKMDSDKKKYRYMCFTWNNLEEFQTRYKSSCHDLWKALESDYLVCQVEEAPETGKLHLQGYVEFKNPRSIGKIKKIMPGAHLERRLGTAKQASDYCKKDGTRKEGPWEFGNWCNKC